ncbi:apolipoprotein L3-like [Notamacropus eugenii]|uniref:apolipoprotein L3-like n=1 Tax=Notamacropus eugenii TaxID=9315 RepID=UPI003B66C879
MDDFDEKVQFEVKMFLQDFSKIRLLLKIHIKELPLAADKIDKIHRDCTITNIVASSAGAVSGILTIAGLALAPVTVGASLALSVGGMGLGAAATVTGFFARLVDDVSELWGISQLENVEGQLRGILKTLSKSAWEIASLVKQLSETFENITLNFRALRMLTSGSIPTTAQINRTFRGTALAMTKTTRISSAVGAAVAVLWEIYAIVQYSKHLSNGAKSTTAEKLREEAQHLEEKLQELSKIYLTLLEMDT